MKRNLFTLIFVAGILSASFSQTDKTLSPGFLPASAENKIDPSTQDVIGTLGNFYHKIKCGLGYTSASVCLNEWYAPFSGLPYSTQPAPLVVSGIPAGAVIEKAFLYSGIICYGTPPINATVTNPLSVTNVFPMTIVSQMPANCYGPVPGTGYYNFRADVTSIISGNGTYYISGFPSYIYNPNNNTDGATLFIIYSDPSATSFVGEMHMYDGVKGTNTGWAFSDTLRGFSACSNSVFAEAFMAVGNLQFPGNTITMNANSSVFPGLWWNFYSLPTAVTSGQNTAVFSINPASGDCYNLCMIGLYFQTTCNSPLSISVSSTQTDCVGGSNGTATINVSGGMAPYYYSWSTVPAQTTATATGLSAGVYTVTVMDSSGCNVPIVDTIMVTSPTLLSSFSPVITNLSCSGANDGSIMLTATGGTAPYNYSWSTVPIQTGQSATGLSAGIYTCTITDANGCTITTTVNITEPVTLVSSVSGVTTYLCFGGCDGIATVIDSGGTFPYSYVWSPSGGTNQTASGLCSGVYTVITTDSNGCTTSATISITQPAAPLSVNVVQTNVSCYWSTNGTATLTPVGGVSPYSYYWPTVGTTNAVTGLSPGTYTYTVTDSMGCSITDSITILQPPFYTLSFPVKDTICEGDSALVSVAASGGTPPYVYTWNPGAIVGPSVWVSPSVTTTYTVTATDANGCTSAIRTVTITVYAEPIAAFTAAPSTTVLYPQEICFTNTSLNATAVQWEFGDNSSAGNLSFICHTYPDTGQYCVTLIADNSGKCFDTTEICVNEVGIFVPNVFSPNGDGTNDLFFAQMNDVQNFECSIYDRWGLKVYEWNSIAGSWNGKNLSGQNCSEGVYYYVISLTWDGLIPIQQKGFVELLR